MFDPDFKVFKIPAQGVAASDRDMAILDEMVEWLHNANHTETWNGDDDGLVLEDQGDDQEDPVVCWPGDYITSIPKSGTGGERRFVRLPAQGRKMLNCQMSDGSEMELWAWALPNGSAVVMPEKGDPVLVIQAVVSDQFPLQWFPEASK